MQLNLELTNFQSISSAKLEFTTGITIISGANSSGKTAILRSLLATLTNPSHAKRYIKHGSTHSEVRLELPDYKHDIVWTRKESGVKYLINGSENNKCGRNTLFDFVSDLPLVYEDSSGRVLNIQTEHDGLFPFDRSATEMFKLFEDIFQISDSSSILASIKKEEYETHGEVKQLKVKVKEVEDKLEYLTTFNSDYNSLDVENHKERCEKVISELIEVNNGYKESDKLQNVLSKVEVPEKQDYDLSVIEDLSEIQTDYEESIKLNDFMKHSFVKQDYDLSVISDYIEIKQDLEVCNELEILKDINVSRQEYDLSAIKNNIDFSKDYLEVQTLVRGMKELKSILDGLLDIKGDLEIDLSGINHCPLCEQEIISHQH